MELAELINTFHMKILPIRLTASINKPLKISYLDSIDDKLSNIIKILDTESFDINKSNIESIFDTKNK